MRRSRAWWVLMGMLTPALAASCGSDDDERPESNSGGTGFDASADAASTANAGTTPNNPHGPFDSGHGGVPSLDGSSPNDDSGASNLPHEGGLPDAGTLDASVSSDASTTNPRLDASVSLDGGHDGGDDTNAAIVQVGSGSLLVLRGTVVTPDTSFEGEVVIDGDTILCTAPSCTGDEGLGVDASIENATIVDTRGIILPGMIDAHNHLLFSIFDKSDWTPSMFYGSHNDWANNTRYGELLDAQQYLNGDAPSPVDLRCEIEKYGELKGLIAGTTSVVVAPGTSQLGCYGSLARSIDLSQNDLPDDKVRTSNSVPDSAAALSVCNAYANDTTDAYLVHVAEGTNATALNEFATLSSRQGGCLLAPQTTIVHGTALDDAALTTMAANDMALVWSPRSNQWFYNSTANIPLALTKGVDVALAADSSAFGGSENLLAELHFAKAHSDVNWSSVLTPQTLVNMVTKNAARALGLSGTIGILEAGAKADITVIHGDRQDPYAAIVAASPSDVRLVTVAGVALYGDQNLSALGPATPGCETLNVCGEEKFICVAENNATDQLNQTLADIQSAISTGLTDYDALVAPMSIAPFSPMAPLVTCP
jgi:cytosine/adenosine deaminase-related metal-dependent hydrolase